ncbi:hypothetical protein A4U88_0559 [Serratia marcescens]|nr:hypothetical protein A4U88_0559 [Serratia marcescens]
MGSNGGSHPHQDWAARCIIAVKCQANGLSDSHANPHQTVMRSLRISFSKNGYNSMG